MSNKEQVFSDSSILRIRAEEKLKDKKNNTIKPETESDVKKLLHELQVHQIELEMQNEELRQANETTESALKKYTMLYDFAPTGFFTLDSEGCIIDLNFTGAEMLNEKRFSLTNSNFRLFISKDSLPVFNKFFSKVYDSHIKESCEIVLSYENHLLSIVYIEGIVIENNKNCLLSLVDISAFRK